MKTFSEVVDAFGIGAMAAILGLEDSHVRVMKARDSIPPEYWGPLIEAAPGHQGNIELNWQMLRAMRDERFSRTEASPSLTPASGQGDPVGAS